MTTETKHIVLSIAGGLVTIVIGYLVWRHENSASQAQADANLQNEEATATQLEDQLNTAATTDTSGYSTTAGQESYPTSSETGVEDTGSDSNLSAILAAFFGSGASSTSSSSGSGSTTTTASGGDSTTTGGGTVTATGGRGGGEPSKGGGIVGISTGGGATPITVTSGGTTTTTPPPTSFPVTHKPTAGPVPVVRRPPSTAGVTTASAS